MTPEIFSNQALEKQHTRNATIWLESDGIIRSKVSPGSVDSLEDAKAFVAAVLKIAPIKRYPALVDIRNKKFTSREARAYYAAQGGNMASVCAILIGSKLTAVLANFFLRINKPTIPVKIFNSEEKALKWLKSF